MLGELPPNVVARRYLDQAGSRSEPGGGGGGLGVGRVGGGWGGGFGRLGSNELDFRALRRQTKKMFQPREGGHSTQPNGSAGTLVSAAGGRAEPRPRLRHARGLQQHQGGEATQAFVPVCVTDNYCMVGHGSGCNPKNLP